MLHGDDHQLPTFDAHMDLAERYAAPDTQRIHPHLRRQMQMSNLEVESVVDDIVNRAQVGQTYQSPFEIANRELLFYRQFYEVHNYQPAPAWSETAFIPLAPPGADSAFITLAGDVERCLHERGPDDHQTVSAAFARNMAYLEYQEHHLNNRRTLHQNQINWTTQHNNARRTLPGIPSQYSEFARYENIDGTWKRLTPRERDRAIANTLPRLARYRSELDIVHQVAATIQTHKAQTHRAIGRLWTPPAAN